MKSLSIVPACLTFLMVVAGMVAPGAAQVSNGSSRLASYLRSAGRYQDPAFPVQEPARDSGFGLPNQTPEQPDESGNRPMVITPDMLGTRQDDGLSSLPQLERETEPDQKVVVREKYAGWKQAGARGSGDPVGDPLRGNWILIDPSGRLSGTVVGSEQVNVVGLPVFLLDRGIVIAQTKTDEEGRFALNNISQGTYSLIGFGEQAIFAFGFNALDHKASLEGKMPGDIRVMASQNKTTIHLDWIRFFTPNVNFRVLGRHVTREGSADAAELYGLDGLSTHAPPAEPATSINSHAIELDENGTFVGRIHHINSRNGRPVELRSGRVILLSGDEVVAGTDADSYGVFRFQGIQPGPYSVVAVSADGIGLIEVDAREGSGNAAANGPLAVDFSLLSPESTGWLNHQANEEAYRRVAGRPIAANNQCEPCNNSDFTMPRRPNPISDFFRGLNAAFEILFYGETFEPGWNGYGIGGMGYGGGVGYGQPGCGGCGNPGCTHCHPPLAAPACGGCGNPGCSHCHPARMVPVAPSCGGCGNPGCTHCHPPVAAPACGGCGNPGCGHCHPVHPGVAPTWSQHPAHGIQHGQPVPAQPALQPHPAAPAAAGVPAGDN